MLIQRRNDHQPSEITPRDLYQRRRDWLKLVAAGSIAGLSGTLAACTPKSDEPDTTLGLRKLTGVNKSALSTAEPVNTYKHITTYNNYYEFGTDKSDPAAYAKQLRVQPWTVIVEGEVAKPRSFGIEDLLQLPLEERVYRLRCVEAWSMVIPWIGFEFNQLARLVEPTSKAKFVEFVTATQPENMIGLRSSVSVRRTHLDDGR